MHSILRSPGAALGCVALAAGTMMACAEVPSAARPVKPPGIVALEPSRERLQEPALVPSHRLAAASVQVAMQDAREASQPTPLPAALERGAHGYLAQMVRGHSQPLRAVLSVHRFHQARSRGGEHLQLDATLVLGVAGAPAPLLAVRGSLAGTLPEFPFDGAEVATFQRSLTAQLLHQLLSNAETVERLNAHLDATTPTAAGIPQSL